MFSSCDLTLILLKQFESIIDIASVSSLLLALELNWILTVLSKELTDAPSIVTIQLMIIGEAQQLGHVCLRLPLDHLQKMCNDYQILIAR